MPTPSAAPAVLTPREYDRLHKDLARILEAAHLRSREAVAKEAVAAYWHLGQRLAAARLTDRAGYRAHVLERLATDLALSVRTLHRAEALYRAYPKRPPPSLGWAHVRELLKLADPEARAHFAELTRAQHLTVRQLVSAVRAHLDAPPEAERPAPKARKRPTEPTYIYKAHVWRVVDADTLDLRIDLGFDVDKRHRVRLAGIDAADANTAKGAEATKHVIERLAAAGTVVVQTRKFDLHGRYVADVFYAAEASGKAAEIGEVFRRGKWLNDELLDKGLAVRWEKAGRRRQGVV